MRAVPAGSLKPPQNDLGRFFNGKNSKSLSNTFYKESGTGLKKQLKKKLFTQKKLTM
jgi:hypothetical protein